MAKRESKRQGAPSADLPMTPMIDVVFLLLIYFIATIRPIDVFAHLDVSRPMAEETRDRVEVPPNLLRIDILPDGGFAVNDRPVRLPDMERFLIRLAELDARQTVLIMSAALATHDQLIQVLDLCAKAGLRNISVVSTN